jgi:hypothetical protein
MVEYDLQIFYDLFFLRSESINIYADESCVIDMVSYTKYQWTNQPANMNLEIDLST